MDALRKEWEQRLLEELPAWAKCLEGRTQNPEDRALRLSSNRVFPAWAKPLIKGNPGTATVLDIGAGPITALGDNWEGHQVKIIPVDPLAEAYNSLLERNGIVPHTQTVYGMGEHLVEQFGEDTFDLAYACESLDQSLDPIECFQQILATLKPGCSLVAFHEANQAERNRYEGPYQWNFSIRESRLLVWNHQGDYDVIDNCPEAGHYHLETEGSYIKFTLTKRS